MSAVPAFGEALRAISSKVPETQVLMIMGTDGIPIEKLVVRPDPNLEAVAAEYTTLLRASVSAASDTGLGELQELHVVTEKLIAILVAITDDYFLFAALSPGALAGRARFALRLAGTSLRREFQ
jgi:predicted regulator of Ras-like GTPase activity (Roadblock/LC7/MglB family)